MACVADPAGARAPPAARAGTRQVPHGSRSRAIFFSLQLVSFVSRQELRLIGDAQQTVDPGIRDGVTASGEADDDARLAVGIQQDPGKATRLHDLAEPAAQHQLGHALHQGPIEILRLDRRQSRNALRRCHRSWQRAHSRTRRSLAMMLKASGVCAIRLTSPREGPIALALMGAARRPGAPVQEQIEPGTRVRDHHVGRSQRVGAEPLGPEHSDGERGLPQHEHVVGTVAHRHDLLRAQRPDVVPLLRTGADYDLGDGSRRGCRGRG